MNTKLSCSLRILLASAVFFFGISSTPAAEMANNSASVVASPSAPAVKPTVVATGYYLTQQKIVVSAVFEHAKRPLTPVEICEEARKKLPSLGIATVYRAIKQFVDEGQVRLVDVPGAAPHYESTAQHHHHFFLCQQCKRVFALVGCVRGVKTLAPSGFRVKQHEIVLYGECDSCIGKGK